MKQAFKTSELKPGMRVEVWTQSNKVIGTGVVTSADRDEIKFNPPLVVTERGRNIKWMVEEAC